MGQQIEPKRAESFRWYAQEFTDATADWSDKKVGEYTMKIISLWAMNEPLPDDGIAIKFLYADEWA